MWIFFCFFVFKVYFMPFKQEVIQIKKVKVHLVTFESFNPSDYLGHLTPIETDRFTSIKSVLKQQQFIATRYLRNQLFGQLPIQYNAIGVPFIDQKGFISISHSSNTVGIAYCEDFQVGLDIELITEKAKRVYQKFLNKTEQALFDLNSNSELTKLWSAKETLYKIANRKGIDFKTELLLVPSTKNMLIGEIIQPNGSDLVEIHTFAHRNYMITLNHSKITHVKQSFKNSRSD